jgi:hypothetical protein
MAGVLAALGTRIASYLSASTHVHDAAGAARTRDLLEVLQPGDVLLVEGRTRVSTAIKFLTQSTWSHAALYVGPYLSRDGGPEHHCFIEADIKEGVRSTTIDEYTGLNARICRPVGLTPQERRAVVDYAISRLGHQYDLRHVFDLARYLLPTPPVPTRFRRRMIALGSGDPTRAICSTLIAQAFQSIRYPILPDIEYLDATTATCPGCVEEVLRIRHHSLFVPRDFDVSPYFEVVKPALAGKFDFRRLRWNDTVIPSRVV